MDKEDYMASLNYIRETLDQFRDETRDRLDANTAALQDLALHQKEQNGNVKNIAECVSRLTKRQDVLHEHQANHRERIALLEAKTEQCADHRERLAQLEAAGEWRAKEQEDTKEAVEWTRNRLWNTASEVAGLTAKIGIILAVVLFLIQNLPQLMK